MTHPAPKPIAAIHAPSGDIAQLVFEDFVGRWSPTHRIAGVLERGYGQADRMRGAGHLESLLSGQRFPIFQGLGSGAKACQVDVVGATSACGTIMSDIAAGCDLVVLSKFGRLESERGGLMPALHAALERSVPVLIYIPSKFEREWRACAEPMFVDMPAQLDAIENWWARVRPDARAQ